MKQASIKKKKIKIFYSSSIFSGMFSLAGAPDLKRNNTKPFSLEPRFDEPDDNFGSVKNNSSKESGHKERSSPTKSSGKKKSKKKENDANGKSDSVAKKGTRHENKKKKEKKSSSSEKVIHNRESGAYTPLSSSLSSGKRSVSSSRRSSVDSLPTKKSLQHRLSSPSSAQHTKNIEEEISYDDDFEEEVVNDVETEAEDEYEDDFISPSAATSKKNISQKISSSMSSLVGKPQVSSPVAQSVIPPSFTSSQPNHVQEDGKKSEALSIPPVSAEEISKRELAFKELALATKESELESRRRQLELEHQIQELKLQQQLQSQAFQLQSFGASGSSTAGREVDSAGALRNEQQPLLREEKLGTRGTIDYRYLSIQRRRRRERERAAAQRREEEERAAHALFQRLSQDVRDVFHELNLSVVAAEKERLVKDERYRREREMRDQREAAERAEKLQKEIQERAEREEKFWQAINDREEKFASKVEARLQKDEAEREDRLRRDLEDRATRMRNERELRDNLDKLDKERRDKSDQEVHQRESILLQTQLTDLKSHFHSQTDELRHQMELDRVHGEELHKLEIEMMVKRHEAALEKLQQQHAHQLAVVETYVSNAGKLEKLTTHIHEEMEASKRLHETLTQERLNTLQEKEKMLQEQQSVLDFMVKDIEKSREDLEKERSRMASLAAKFDISVSQCSRNAEEDRRIFQEAFSRQETLRQQIEKDRKLMISEVAHERKVVDQQHEEFLARKMEMINEVHTERSLLAKEKWEANAARERQNREESSLLQSLHAREEEYRTKLATMEENYLKVQEMKIEQKQILDEVTLEKDRIREERFAFELEKQELLQQFNSVRLRAEEGVSAQERLRKQLIDERAEKEKQSFNAAALESRVSDFSPPHSPAASASRFQLDLVNQRAILQKIKSR